MEKIRLTKHEKEILRLLYSHNYPVPVPAKDCKDFLKLESLGLVEHLETDQSISELYGPDLTEMGHDYFKFNPNLKNPGCITKDDIISFIAQFFSNLMKP